MNSKQIDFMLKVLENELLNISDACEYEDYGTGLDRSVMSSACKKTMVMLQKLDKENKKKLKKK